MNGISKLIHMRSFWTALFTLLGIVLHEVGGSDIINADTQPVFVATILALIGGGAISDAAETHHQAHGDMLQSAVSEAAERRMR